MKMMDFFRVVDKLRKIPRAGWVERGIKDPETVADHSYMMAAMCMALCPADLDKNKIVKMSLIHDLPESETGDMITLENWPEGGTISESEKRKLEDDALKKYSVTLTPDLQKRSSRCGMNSKTESQKKPYS